MKLEKLIRKQPESRPESGPTMKAEHSCRQSRLTTQSLKAILPRGIRVGEYHTPRPKPYYVRWGKERRFQGFAREDERNRRALELARGIEREGRLVALFNAREWADFKRLQIETGLSWPQIRQIVRNATESGEKAVSTGDAVARYIAQRESEGTSGDTLRHIRIDLSRWAAFRGEKFVSRCEAQDVRDWLSWLRDKEGFQDLTLRNHRKDLRTFFEWVRIELKARPDNPCDPVKPPGFWESDRRPLSLIDAHKLLRANRDHAVAPRLALEMFGGLRTSSVERVRLDHIRFDVRGIEMPGALHKSRKRKFRQGQPSVVWEWLAIARQATWDGITERNYDDQKRDAFIRAGVKNPGNALRHAFASYHLAAFKNPPLTSYLMQHCNQQTTLGYEGMALESDSVAYLSLTPCRVLMGTDEIVRTAAAYTHASREGNLHVRGIV